ncbi:hypothetical protein [Mycobacterium sp. 29Ha]|uniref:hypothetical protein n=1 Tax=Mycobacterium sp. 29Ha TaxID=2939268 RepID=UPI002938D579|nr:hypothetical protein [Mycobacterium sp. 29Ha]MDV3133351.1 hypothetical protein [Mycobacterium sp. 29Ha]
MITNTYRLAVALQAKAIDDIDLHHGGVYTIAHTFGADITVIARYRTGADQRIVQMWARDAEAHLLGSAEASTPAGGGIIASHVTAFRSGPLRWERRVIPTAAQYRNPAELPSHPSQAEIGFHACGRADYYLSHDWAPGRSPRDTTWSLLVGTAHTGLVLARTKVDVDTAIHYAAELDNRHLVAV